MWKREKNRLISNLLKKPMAFLGFSGIFLKIIQVCIPLEEPPPLVVYCSRPFLKHMQYAFPIIVYFLFEFFRKQNFSFIIQNHINMFTKYWYQSKNLYGISGLLNIDLSSLPIYAHYKFIFKYTLLERLS